MWRRKSVPAWLGEELVPVVHGRAPRAPRRALNRLKRAARGAKVWRAHREHFYQRAVQGGASHGRVAAQVLACNAVLIVLAVAAARGLVWPAFLVSAAAVAALLAMLERRGRR